jgi:glutathione S-transferase
MIPPLQLDIEDRMKLYEFAPTRSIRARWTLQELGVPFEAVTVNMLAGEHRKPEFLAINPAGKIPVLVDDDAVLTESIAIVVYLAEKYPDKGLIPTGLRGRAEVMRWLLFAATELEQPLWRMAKHKLIYPEEKRLPGDIALARDEFIAMAQVLDRHMAGREFVAGDSLTVADFVLGYTLDWATLGDLLDGLPRLEAYRERLYARPRAPTRIKDAWEKVRGA